MINALDLKRLENKFNRVMSINSTRNRCDCKELWGKIVQGHNPRPYHNLQLAFEDLFSKQEIETELTYISSAMIIAMLFRYLIYSPAQAQKSLEQSIDYMSFVLKDAYGWRNHRIEESVSLIEKSHSFVILSEHSPFQEKLICDMKMARLSKPYRVFITDRINVTAELRNSFGLEKIYRMELNVLEALLKRKTFFYTNLYKPSTELLQENLGKRIEELKKKPELLPTK